MASGYSKGFSSRIAKGCVNFDNGLIALSSKWFGILLWFSNKFVGKLYFSCKKRWLSIDAGRQEVVRNRAITRALLVYLRTRVILLFADAFHCTNLVPKSQILEPRWAKQLATSVGSQLPCVTWEKTLYNLLAWFLDFVFLTAAWWPTSICFRLLSSHRC